MDQSAFEEQAVKTYFDNLNFLQLTQPLVYAKVNALNNAIEKGYHKEKYSLEYKDGYFDVLELETNKWLYDSDSNKHAQLAAKSVDYTKSGNLYETFYNVKISEEYAKEVEELGIETNSYSGAAKLIHYSNEYADKTTHMKKLYKFVFIGTGLGIHLLEIHKKISSNVYFIVEDDLELFRLSLFVTNYKELCNNNAELVFSVFDDDGEFASNASIFLSKHFVYNHYIKYFHILSHSQQRLQELQNIILGQTYLTFNYSALTTSILRPLIHIKEKYHLLDIKSSYKDTVLYKKPVLLLGAGPSFEKNIDWLKKNHKKFITVAVSAILAKLEELDIKPDIITHVHGFSDALPHIRKVKDISFFDTSISLFGGFTEPAFAAYFKKENVFMFEGTSRYKRNHDGITSSNIGSLSTGLFLRMDTKNLYLLGLDFALDQESGQTHSNIHEYSKSYELKTDDTLGGEKEYRKTIALIKGNFCDEVYTTSLMNGWLFECKGLIRLFKTKEQKIYNLSDGAFIPGTEPLTPTSKDISSLENIDKDKLYNELFSLFNSKSENFLTEIEVNDLKSRMEYCDKISAIINKHMQTNHQSLEHYHYNLLGLFQDLLTEEREIGSSDIDHILTLYLQFVSGYIFDLINTKEIKNYKKLIKQIEKSVMPQILRVVNYFKDEIEKQYKYHKEELKKNSEFK